MVETKLPPGFRFHPRDEELICDYLMKKVTCYDSTLMIEVDLNKCEPWDIPETACVGGKEWYFYSQRDRKYAIGLRTNRATACGYWKATGKDRPILRKGALVGMRKTLVFYQGRAPKGRKTDWVMHEFRLEGQFAPTKTSSLKEDWVLCRVVYKNKEAAAAAAKSTNNNMGRTSCSYDDMTGSSSTSLPPLMDSSSYITFDNQFEQVPCFSIFSQNQINTTNNSNYISSNGNIVEPNLVLPNNDLTNMIMPNYGGGISDLGVYLNNPPACEKDVLKAVLSQLTKLESSGTNMTTSSSLCDASSESYLYR